MTCFEKYKKNITTYPTIFVMRKFIYFLRYVLITRLTCKWSMLNDFTHPNVKRNENIKT